MDYPDLSTLNEELQAIIDGKGGANVYKMLMHSPNVAPGFTAMADAVMWAPSWPATWRELAIIRVGHHYSAPYEIHHHERIGRQVGLSEEQMATCAIDASQEILTTEEKTILRLTDALVQNHKLSEAEVTVALTLMDANGLADFVLTVGFYQAVSNFLNTFNVQVETEGPFAKATVGS